MIGELKAFEAGNCRYCNSPYIIGKIQRNEADGLEYLYQNKEVDIYENYGNNEFVSIDYFLMSNEFNEEEVDHDILEEYKVCAKCGAIYAAGNLNARRCNCGDSFQHSIFKVLQSKNQNYNELYISLTQEMAGSEIRMNRLTAFFLIENSIDAESTELHPKLKEILLELRLDKDLFAHYYERIQKLLS